MLPANLEIASATFSCGLAARSSAARLRSRAWMFRFRTEFKAPLAGRDIEFDKGHLRDALDARKHRLVPTSQRICRRHLQYHLPQAATANCSAWAPVKHWCVCV